MRTSILTYHSTITGVTLVTSSRIEFTLRLITFKVLKGLAHLYLSELISVLPLSSYNLRRNYNGTLLCTPNLNLREPLGIADFPQPNSLPLAIWNVDQSIETFKKKLKTHLFTKVLTERQS